MGNKKENIFLIDGNALCCRAFYAIQRLATSQGMPTNAIYGFINMLRKIIRENSPDMIGVVFDPKGSTARHKKYDDYKIQRRPMPDDLAAQMPRIKEVVLAHNIPVYELPGFEADDVIATLVVKARKSGHEVVIVTGDKDALQLVDDGTKVLSPMINETKIYDRAGVIEKYGVAPERMTDLMALMGDASDNVPGVKGVGKVTAKKLIQKYGSLEEVYRNIDKITPESLRKKLVDEKKNAMLSKELVVLDDGLEVDLDESGMRMAPPDNEALAKLYKEFEFKKLLREVSKSAEAPLECRVHKKSGEVRKALESIGKGTTVAFHLAGHGGDASIQGIALSWREGEAHYIPFDAAKSGEQEEIKSAVRSFFEDRETPKAGYDVKNTFLRLGEYGIVPGNAGFDVMIADYLVEPSNPDHSLETITMRYLGCGISPGREWDETGQGMLDLSEAGFSESACRTCDTVLRLYGTLEGELKKKQLEALFNDVEMPLTKVLADMEREGVGIDAGRMEETSLKTGKKLSGVIKKIYKLAGEEFNINSPKQLQHILFDKLGLEPVKKIKTGTSTDESVLSRLAADNELPRAILEYRVLNKIKTTYCDSIMAMMDKKTGRLHTHFNQAVTSTGRLSSSEPNFQNIPVKTEIGREIRRAFIAGGAQRALLSADYSQIELRVLAHLSKDENLTKAFNNKEDVHAFTASLIFDTDISGVTDRMRSVAKTVNFGIIYGMSAFGLAKDLDIGVGEAHEFIESYFKRYPGVKAFIDGTIDDVRARGYVTTILSRRRYIPEISNPNDRIRSFAERTAVNTAVQGSAADIIKMAMLACHREFEATDVRMVIQVHDELVFALPEKEIVTAARKIKNIMERVKKLDVPITVNVEAGENWTDMEGITVP